MHPKFQSMLWAAFAVATLGVHAYLTPSRTPASPTTARAEPTPSTPLSPSPTPMATDPAAAGEGLHLELSVGLVPAAHTVEVKARVTLYQGDSGAGPVRFLLHRGMAPRVSSPGASLRGAPLAEVGIGDPLTAYQVTLQPGVRVFELEYGGEIYHPLEEYGQDYARSFGWTPGVIGDAYVYLTRGSGWYPVFGEELVRFRLEVQAPGGWTAVSQGVRLDHSDAPGGSRVIWEESHPQDQIYLLAAPFQVYEREAGAVSTQVYLRSSDAPLAERYLDATAQYLDLYGGLLGPYPYGKFALVENFWETGYGMPSFTLLGPTVIRLPFIPTSSYPHEILHNWWGNGVYVDYPTGNWSEGLTAYLSDHLIQEMRGKGAEHRQSSLQKYADYVNADREFPLAAFRSRHGSASQAVGYTKMMMFAHMLRRSLGDDVFIEALRGFYRENRFRTASFAELEAAFTAAAGRSQGDAFRQWVDRTGAPELILEDASTVASESGYTLHVSLEQVQGGPPYRLLVPLAATLEGREQAEQLSVVMEGGRLEWDWDLPARPLRVDVDPEFDLMRRLHPEEIPPALSGVFGAPRIAVVLPAAAGERARSAYRALARSWGESGNVDLEILRDDQLEELPRGRAVWLFGWENRLLDHLGPALTAYGAALDGSGAQLPGLALPREGNAVALGLRNPEEPSQGIGVFAADRPDLVPMLGRRLPHFHKYSYLAFEGEQATNTLRGRWPVVNSPLTIQLKQGAQSPRGGLRPQSALAPPLSIVEKSRY